VSSASGSAAVAARLLNAWRRLGGQPVGRWLFSRMLGRMIPYTGSMHATVLMLEPGHARVQLREHRAVRNHLGSVHAAALTNLGELASGLAMMTGAPPDVRGIPIRLTTEFHKKARGVLLAESRATVPAVSEPVDHEVVADIVDATGDLVARVTALWRLAPLTDEPPTSVSSASTSTSQR
jgi:acyl-coenzyme A thioesterase PaaI-like protein